MNELCDFETVKVLMRKEGILTEARGELSDKSTADLFGNCSSLRSERSEVYVIQIDFVGQAVTAIQDGVDITKAIGSALELECPEGMIVERGGIVTANLKKPFEDSWIGGGLIEIDIRIRAIVPKGIEQETPVEFENGAKV
jgi:hypothetical protein